jgi:transposase
MYRIGVDYHERMSAVHILDENGKKDKAFTVQGRWPKLVEALSKQPGPFEVCFEASNGYGYLHDNLAPLAKRVVVAHPGQLRPIFRSKHKHDRADAEKLAKLLYLDALPPVYVPKPFMRNWGRLITFRGRLVEGRTAIMNRIRGLLRRLGIEAPKGLWTGKGLAWLAQVELPEPAALERELLVDELRQARSRIKRVEKELNKIAKADPRVGLLKTIPGVGTRTAEAVVAWIDDARRFARIKAVGCYFGMVPCEDSSAGKQRLGHITKQGPALVRKLAVEAAWQAVRRSPKARAYFERVTQGDPDRKKIAIVATGHYLLRCMCAMLRDLRPWKEQQQTATAPVSEQPA